MFVSSLSDSYILVLTFVFIKSEVLFALYVMRSMWEFQDMPLDMSTPRYLPLETTSWT